jgi:hypothetical protein
VRKGNADTEDLVVDGRIILKRAVIVVESVRIVDFI